MILQKIAIHVFKEMLFKKKRHKKNMTKKRDLILALDQILH